MRQTPPPDLDEAYDWWMSRQGREWPVIDAKPLGFIARLSKAKFRDLAAAILLAGFVLPLLILFGGIFALGLWDAVTHP